ncbi:hypothetical protein FHS27_006420 [Rhodopirellula rubra]|uniref:Uncharacterized protein n=2 Tax=Aporhodopirellula rubra TaxID=980271 RepID=A0A7W5E5M9_9BACT|nr:hypothetical protein [Aporhodopirellula rubra]
MTQNAPPHESRKNRTVVCSENHILMKLSFVIFLLVWQFLLATFLTLGGIENEKLGTMAKMLWGVNLLWIGVFGIISLYLRDHVREIGQRLGGKRLTIFFTSVTALALIEEAITTAMTNCAPLFGAEIGEVYITASANYLDVVFYHSVVVFLPQFALLGWLLRKYAISPFAVFVCYGLTGFVNEALFAGPNPLLLPQWILIYGLLVFLPAHLFSTDKDRKPMRWYFFPAVVLLPILASVPMVGLLLFVIAPGHPSIHFPPM